MRQPQAHPTYYDPAPTAGSSPEATVDVCVYGGTPAGVTAAVQAARDGMSVALIENSAHLGGITAAGLGWTDFGNKETIGGLSREFYRQVGRHYGEHEKWAFEPHVAEGIFDRWVADFQIPVYRREFLDRVRMDGARIDAIRLESGRVFRARAFIDATYEGDLLAHARVTHIVGREDNRAYGETLNGMQVRGKHQFEHIVDPWRTAGAPGSGLLPGIESVTDYTQGAGDTRIQAYNFRMCLTDQADNRRAVTRPAGYDREEYELLARYFRTGWNEVFAKFDRIPGGKTDTNNHGAVSTDFIGRNHDWPRASFRERERIFQAHVTYQQGLQWFLANDDAVPRNIREAYREWGLPLDEFTKTGGWPHALYVREARRMVADEVVTENTCRGRLSVEDPVGMGAYAMDSHNCRRIIVGGVLRNEGDVQEAGFAPYGISWRALIPRRGECTNLIVPVCLSASHIAFGSIRMEPVFMILGQSAAVAARLLLQESCATHDLPYAVLRDQLLAVGQVLNTPETAARPNEVV